MIITKDKPKKFKKLDEKRRFIKFLKDEKRRLKKTLKINPYEDLEPYAYAISQTLKDIEK